MISCPPRHLASCLVAAISCLISVPTSARADLLTTGDLIVTVNDFTGFTYPPVYLAEYRTDGTRVQKIGTVPLPPDDTAGGQNARANVLSPDGHSIDVINSSTSQHSYLATYDLNAKTWTQETATNWKGTTSSVNGGVGVYGSYVFASNENSADGGLLRFNASDTVDHFGPDPFTSIINLNVTSHGLVYALDGQSNVYQYDATTLALKHTFAVKFEEDEAVAGAADGSFYVATAQGQIEHYAADGTFLKSITVGTEFFTSIAINDQTGQIALGTFRTGEVYLTDLNLDTPTSFVATDPSTLRVKGDTFVSWVTPSISSVPEPSSYALAGVMGLAAVAGAWRRRKPG